MPANFLGRNISYITQGIRNKDLLHAAYYISFDMFVLYHVKTSNDFYSIQYSVEYEVST